MAGNKSNLYETSKERLKVLLFLRESGGGIREQVRCLAKHLSRRKAECCVCGTKDDWLREELEKLKVPFVSTAGRVGLSAFFVCRRLLRQGYDVIHSHGYRSLLLAAAANSRAKIHHICTIHTLLPSDIFIGGFGRWKKKLLQRAFRKAAKVIAVSQAVHENILSHFPEVKEKLEVVYPGIDLEELSQPMRTRRSTLAYALGLDTSLPIVGVVARLAPEKGVADFLRAAQILVKRDVMAEFIIIGDGPLRKELEAQAHELGLSACTHFIGYRPDPAQLMRIFHVLVIPSLSEALSLVAVTGSLIGVPIAAYDVGGLREATNPESSILVPPGNPTELADGIYQLLEQPAEAGDSKAFETEEVEFKPGLPIDLGIGRTTFEMTEDTFLRLDEPHPRSADTVTAKKLRDKFSADKMAARLMEIYAQEVAEATQK